jgi:hypothetical protein
MLRSSLPLLLVSALLGAGGPTTAQVPLIEHADGPEITDLPMTCAAAGDIDGDGFGDAALGRPIAREVRGAVALVSGRDGSELWRREGSGFAEGLGRTVAAGADLDADGIGDVAVVGFQVVPTQGYLVHALSGRDGTTIWSVFDSGSSITALRFVGDVDGDGRGDLLCGAPFAAASGFASGRATLRSGHSGAPLYSLQGPAALDVLGQALAPLGDLDADGVPDFAIGAPMAASQGSFHEGAGYVLLVSGRSGRALRRIDGAIARGGFGFALAALDDLDRDGAIDLAIGAPHEPGGGAVYFVSSRSGAILRRVGGSASDQLCGFDVARVGDLGGDGLAECAIAHPGEDSAGVVRVVDGASSAVLATLRGEVGARFGARLASAFDPNRDGADDLWVLRDPAPPLVGAFTLYSLRSPASFGAGCGSGARAPELALQPLRLGATAQLTCRGAPALAPGCALVSLAPRRPLALEASCALYLELATVFDRRELMSDGNGDAALAIPVPFDPWLVGIAIGAQVGWVDIGGTRGFALTQGVYGVLEP